MSFYDKSDYQRGQIAVIEEIERQIKNDALNFSTVAETEDYQNDPRLCLTSVHFPRIDLVQQIKKDLLDPLENIEPGHFYYPLDCLHMTIKNIKTIADPPNFSQSDTQLAKKVFERVIPRHKKFQVFYYRLMLFKSNLSLIGTSDEELDLIHLDLDQELNKEGIPDDKKYTNKNHFFSNMTLIRFSSPIGEGFRKKIDQLSGSILWDPYIVDSVTLLTSNAAMMKRKIIEEWTLR